MSALLDGVEVLGAVNTPDDVLLAQVAASIRRGHPQVWPVRPNRERVCLVGGGPSLASTVDELRDLVFAGAKLVTVNGAYQWCVARNLQPKAQIVLDARASNARFVDPDVPSCRYYLCSQCAPATWDAVEGRSHVAIWHDESTAAIKAELDQYYRKRWHAIPGGTTVGTRAIGLLATLGFLRFDLFGFDSCWIDGAHHAYEQPENAQDRRIRLDVHPTGRPDLTRAFEVAPWHLKQLEDLLLMIRTNGERFVLNVHGEGLLAYVLRAGAEVQLTTKE